MTEEESKELASQLRKPHGEMGIEVGNGMNKGNLLINQDAVRALEVKDNDRILEIGPGNGFLASSLLESAANVTYAGCDFSELMVSQANALNQPLVATNQAQFVHADCDNMPFASESFTKVLTVNTIYFWPDAHAALKEMYRVLAPNGRLVIGLRPEQNMRAMPFTQYGFAFWTEEKLRQLLEASPFTLLEIQHHFEETIEFAGQTLHMENMVVVAERKVLDARTPP